MTHIVSKLTIVGSDSGLSPGRHLAIIWANDGILLIGTLGANLSDILIEIHTFSLKKIHLKMSSAKWWLLGLGRNVLIIHLPLVPHRWTRSSLIQTMASSHYLNQCLTSLQSHPKEQISTKNIKIDQFPLTIWHSVLSPATLPPFHQGGGGGVNSCPPSADHMRQWFGSALVQIMVCRLFGTKPLSKPMLGYYQLDP